MITGARRRRRRETARWEQQNRDALIQQARRLAIALYHGAVIEVATYHSGIVLQRGETLWAETWCRCSLDEDPSDLDQSWLPLSCWAITNRRMVGQLFSGQHIDWAWDRIEACQANLVRNGEWASVVVGVQQQQQPNQTDVDIIWAKHPTTGEDVPVITDAALQTSAPQAPDDKQTVYFYGPGVAPMAVALVFKIHGVVALLQHPGLAPLMVPRTPPKPMPALPAGDPHNEIGDILRKISHG